MRELNRGCELCGLGNDRFFLTFKLEGTIHLGGFFDGERFAALFYAPANGTGNARRLVEHQHVARDFAVDAEGLRECSNGAADRAVIVHMNHLSPGRQAAVHGARNRDVVAETAHASIDLAVDPRGLDESKNIAVDAAADSDFLSPNVKVSVDGAVYAELLPGEIQIAFH